MPPLSEPDRSEVVPVPGGRCEISWWLSPAVDEPPAEAGRLAAEALDEATVSDAQWASWFRLLDDDPDLDSCLSFDFTGPPTSRPSVRTCDRLSTMPAIPTPNE